MANRRQFITGFATASTVAIAGCSSSEPASEEDESESASEEDGSEAESEIETESGEQTGPEAVVEQYREGTIEADSEKINNTLHPDSDELDSITGYTEPFDGEVLNYEINEISISDYEIAGDVSKEDLDEIWGDDYAVVERNETYYQESTGENSVELHYVVVKHENRWRMWGAIELNK